ncbi:MAG: cell division protein FtsX [Sphingobacteriales bacterium 50-39]|nr:ABC transporter permease [Sphingobacteriales bacterium]OJW52906.1 MAG: cell division protein FtsX [Sphingobacteriales bacterium 50-39]
MLLNYLKVALRSLWKTKGFTAINIIGLATGLGVCLLIALYVLDELSYDKYNPKADRIYRLDAEIYFNNTLFNAATSPKPLPVTLVKEYPQVEQMVRISYFNSESDIMIKKGSEWVQDHRLAFADSTFFQVFPIPLVAGDPATALKEPHSIVIDETAARRYFNSTDVVGKTLELQGNTLCKVTGVYKNIPTASHFHFSFIRPLRDTWMGDEHRWLSNNVASYILVRPGTKRTVLQSRVDATINTYLSRELQDILHISSRDMQQQGSYFRYHLMPLEDIHLHSDKSYEFEPNGNINDVYVFSCIAILILVIACVNFMNLSTARSANRAKEVGIRKVAGSTRGHLIAQFLMESMLLSLFSLLLAIGIALALLPLFNHLAGKELYMGAIFSPRLFLVLLGLTILVGCLAGSYPAFYLSSFQPILVLKGKIASGFKSSWLRSSLVVFQFFISIGLIIGTIVIHDQLSYIRNRRVGYDRDQVLIIHNAFSAGDGMKSFCKELPKLSGVADATLSGDMPTQGGGYNQNAWWRSPVMSAQSTVVLTNLYIDDQYIPTLGMQMVKGRNFSPNYPTDTMGVILNESAIALLGWKDPLKERLYQPDDSMRPRAFPVIGVVKDFNFSSMHDKIGPVVMTLADNRRNLAIRLRPGDIHSSVSKIETKWREFANGVPFNYTFMDDDFNKLYHAEAQTGELFVAFAAFAILIACLGLFGLVTYATEQRTKEIGIRKVLGARVTRIVALLSRDFARLVLIAALIAFPVAWWAMHKWLQSFTYRTDINWWIFPLAGAAAFLIAMATMCFQTIRAALANPVTSLRSE